MSRQNFLDDQPWDEIHEDVQIRTRAFWRPLGAMLGALLHELLPGSPGFKLHMHYGAEEIFFIADPRSATVMLRSSFRRATSCIAPRGSTVSIHLRTQRMNPCEYSLSRRAASQT